VGNVSAGWDGRPRISVYLKDDISDARAKDVSQALDKMAHVASVRYISREQALKEFTSMSGFGDVLSTLDKNPLPPVVEVVPAETQPGMVKMLATNIRGVGDVDSVSVDLAWIQRLYAILALGRSFVTALAFFLGLGVLLSIGNTIRLAIENRRAEIEVVKLVGGTDSFVRRPFLYLGFWYGVGGAVVAWVMVEGSLIFLSGPVDRLVMSYSDNFALTGLGFGTTMILLAGGGLLGILGAGIAVRRHLHEIEPQ
ncbi:MAG TPA: permease-like cell division protein FtsX, partial [Pseudomonadales bacterium]|nr:permease-like cell division protein FtsX [Pseudomonadales bacterium]